LDPVLRRAYNASYTDERFARYARALHASVGCEPGFRLAETPVFFERALADRLATAASEIVAQLTEPATAAALAAHVPERFAVDDGSGLPQFAVLDFAIVRGAGGRLEPQLVELQGFPSLLAFEVMQCDAWLAELDGAARDLAPWFGDFDRSSTLALARATLLGDADPAQTVLLDVEPRAQKTYCDFAATETLFGIPPCDPRELFTRGRRVYRRDADGRETRVTRIYNRVVGDEFMRADVLPFDPRDDIELTWAPHPRWFWAWSKVSLPYLDHPAVPRTTVLDRIAEIPDHVSDRYVLKPLFSFAGSGVNVRPTRADIAAIPAHERAGWCLQEKIAYAPALTTPDGEGVKIEIRVMLLRPDDAPSLVPVTNLCRLSRGEMIGVDYNRDRTWVGSSIGLWPARHAHARAGNSTSS
jgi:hypothetical protein